MFLINYTTSVIKAFTDSIMCPNLSPFLPCQLPWGSISPKDTLNCECPSHVLKWLAGSYNQQILSKRISLSPTV